MDQHRALGAQAADDPMDGDVQNAWLDRPMVGRGHVQKSNPLAREGVAVVARLGAEIDDRAEAPRAELRLAAGFRSRAHGQVG
jgi:hypothetical protein